MAQTVIYKGTDGTITISGVTSQPSGSPLTGATVTGTLYAPNGTTPSGWSGVAFSDQGGGTYTVNFSSSIIPSTGQYNLQIVITLSGLSLTINHTVIVDNMQV